MASKTQQQLNFPVRKSGRQSKPSRIILETNEQKSLSAKKESKREEQEDTPRRRATAKARTQSTGGSQSLPENVTPKRTARRQRQKKDQSPCVRDCTPQQNNIKDTNCEDGATPWKPGRPKKTDSAWHAQFEDGASPCKRDRTPQRTVSTRTCENDASPCRRERTPQRHLSAKRILQIDPGSPSKRDRTPVRNAASRKQQQSEENASSPCKSPSKRKAGAAVSPPSPPKSPCKSGRNVEQRSSRASSPDIQSEESDSEEEDNQSASHTCVWPHNSPMKAARYNLGNSSGPLSPCGKGTKALTKNKDGDGLAEVQPVKNVHELRSPSKQRPGSVLPPPTPPVSPFVIGFYRKPAAQENGSSMVAPSTPTKNHREVLSPRKSAPTTPEKQLQQCEQSSRGLSPMRPGTLTPLKQQQTPRGMASPQKTLRGMASPQKTPCSPSRRLFTNSPQRLTSPRKMAAQENEENFTLKSPKLLTKLKVARADGSSYQRTKQSLHTAKPEQLVGREEEVKTITHFLRMHLEKESSGSLYISGAPGTGKTAALLHIIDDFQAEYTCRIAYLNCMMVKDVNSVFRRLHSELSGKPAAGRTSVKDMETLVTSSKHSMILVLDEIDQLDSKNQEVLYTIFEWPSLLNSKLILVGVANALDLTDRILPRLQAKPKCRPILLHFAPYTRTQITAIIQERLTKSGETVVDNSAVQFCARKVAAVAGDMRKALDVCRRAVELVESETRCQTVLKAADCNSPSKRQAGPAVKRVGVGHISKVMGEVYGTSVQSQHSEGVPLQQKLTVCTLLLMVKTARIKEVLLGKLHEAYCKVSRRQQMTPVDQSEFHSLCVLLEARGVISIKKAKETRLLKITLRQDEKELEQTLKDKVLVSAILSTGLPK